MFGSNEYDVAVVGAGPAGSTVAALLAAKGHQVIVLERDKHPRYHIGESLITGVLPVLEQLDLVDRVERLGFPRKRGATLLWGADSRVWDFRFADSSDYAYSWQVRRADFDLDFSRG